MSEAELFRTTELRKRIFGAVSHPRALEIAFNDGRLVLGGPVLDSEVDQVLGIASEFGPFENRLSVLHEIPELHERPAEIPSAPPAIQIPMRLLVGGLGSLLAIYGWRRRDWSGGLITALGIGGVVQMASGARLMRLIGSVVSPVISIREQIQVSVPVEFAYQWWTQFQNFSRFMSYVADVSVNDSGGISWKVIGPAGVPFHWDAQITRMEPSSLIEWKSIPRTAVSHFGRIGFSGINERESRIEIELSYAPPAGLLGYSLVKLLGFDPSEKIESDLLVMRELIERDYRVEGPRSADQPA